jgi:hypothetical protein
MKKLTILFVFTFIIMFSFAQVQRKANVANKTDSAAVATERKPVSRGEKKQMIKDLNLNKDQKSKLKEIRQSSKAKKDAIENDEKLNADEKTAKLKELQREQAKSTMTILNDEQKEKMRKMRKNKKGKQMSEE